MKRNVQRAAILPNAIVDIFVCNYIAVRCWIGLFHYPFELDVSLKWFLVILNYIYFLILGATDKRSFRNRFENLSCDAPLLLCLASLLIYNDENKYSIVKYYTYTV